MEKRSSIYEVESVDADIIAKLRNENEVLREAVEDASRQIEFLTVECKAWRQIHEADQQAIQSIIGQMSAIPAPGGDQWKL